MPDIHFECPKCKQTLDAAEELATQLIDCPSCKEVIEVPVRSQPIVTMPPAVAAPMQTSEDAPNPQHSKRRTRYEHTAVVLHFDRKSFAMTRTDLLQGLTGESIVQLDMLGEEGWELVTVLPYTSGRTGLSVFSSTTETDAAMGFFKRVKL
jgi:phage FluMu protein Com